MFLPFSKVGTSVIVPLLHCPGRPAGSCPRAGWRGRSRTVGHERDLAAVRRPRGLRSAERVLRHVAQGLRIQVVDEEVAEAAGEGREHDLLAVGREARRVDLAEVRERHPSLLPFLASMTTERGPALRPRPPRREALPARSKEPAELMNWIDSPGAGPPPCARAAWSRCPSSCPAGTARRRRGHARRGRPGGRRRD